jgi:peptide/nickel transport system permease protein
MAVESRRLCANGWLRTGGGLFSLLLAAALLGPWLSPHDPQAMAFVPLSPPDGSHWLGINDAGIDLFAELLHGLRNTLAFGLVGGISALALGVGVGLVAAWFGGAVDALSMRLADVLLAIPLVMPLLLLAVLAPPQPLVLALLLALLSWPSTARGIRSQALSLRNRPHVAAARRMGGSAAYILGRHLLPELAPLFLAGLAGKIRMALAMEASLAFLGLFEPGRKSLGQILRDGLNYYYLDIWWHWLLPPLLCLSLLILSLTLLAVGCEGLFDPRLKEG